VVVPWLSVVDRPKTFPELSYSVRDCASAAPVITTSAASATMIGFISRASWQVWSFFYSCWQGLFDCRTQYSHMSFEGDVLVGTSQ
jgi:hypothetical protein